MPTSNSVRPSGAKGTKIILNGVAIWCRYGTWTLDDEFTYEGNRYRFLGVEELTASVVTFHAVRMGPVNGDGTAWTNVKFADCKDWQKVPKKRRFSVGRQVVAPR